METEEIKEFWKNCIQHPDICELRSFQVSQNFIAQFATKEIFVIRVILLY